MIGLNALLLAQTETPPQPVLPDAPSASQQAQTGGNGTTTTTGDPNQSLPPNGTGGGGFDPFTLIMLLGVVVLFVFMFGGQRKEKKKRQAMLAAMKKNDRVQTVGGVLGTITELKDDEVTLKVDENSNTRMRFARSAIQSVIEDKAE